MKMIRLTRRGSSILCMILAMTGPAFAYGPEGLFGGRPNPDNTAAVQNAVQTDVQPERAVSVLQHPRPDYDPVPVTVGSFNLFPSLEVGAAYDSNIYATPATGRADDEITSLRPTLNAVSTWSRHALAFTASGDSNFFASHTKEDYNNALIGAQGRYDIANQTWLAARGGYQYAAEARTSPNNAGGSEPTTFNAYTAGLSGFRGAGVVQAQLDYDLKRLTYNNTPSATGSINQTFRDRDEHVMGGKVFYAVSDNFKPYVQAHYNIRQYDNNSARSSDGYDASAGAKWDFGGITTLDAYAGWLSQNYGNFGVSPTNSGVNFGGRLTWNVTGLTTVALEGNRSIEETTVAGFNSFKATGGSATVTHELLRNLLVEGHAAYTQDAFNGSGSRTDDIVNAGSGARWFLNNHVYTDVDYNWSHRSSNQAAQGYVDHLVMMRVGLQY